MSTSSNPYSSAKKSAPSNPQNSPTVPAVYTDYQGAGGKYPESPQAGGGHVTGHHTYHYQSHPYGYPTTTLGPPHQQHHHHSQGHPSAGGSGTGSSHYHSSRRNNVASHYLPLRPLPSYYAGSPYSTPVPLVNVPKGYRAPATPAAPTHTSGAGDRPPPRTTVTSYYYPHSNLQPVQPPAQSAGGGPGPSAHHYHHHHRGGGEVMIRFHNGTMIPLVARTPRNVYSPAATTPASSSAHDTSDRPPLSDKQLLRQRFAQRGVCIDQSLRIGSGRYSKVMTAALRDGGTVAIKIINTNRVTHEFRTKFLPRELECWERLRHAHLVLLLARDEYAGRVFLFMEFGEGGDMLAHVQKNGPVPEATAALWMRQIISGVAHMHRVGIVHRDLKLENIIIFQPNLVKVADFGFARKITADLSTTYCGSKSYSAPEILSGQPYAPHKADIWSLGVIAYVILTDRMPFKDSMANTEIVNAQKRRMYSYPPQLAISTAARTSIDTLMTFDHRMRPDIHHSARLPWFLSHAPYPMGERA